MQDFGVWSIICRFAFSLFKMLFEPLVVYRKNCLLLWSILKCLQNKRALVLILSYFYTYDVTFGNKIKEIGATKMTDVATSSVSSELVFFDKILTLGNREVQIAAEPVTGKFHFIVLKDTS